MFDTDTLLCLIDDRNRLCSVYEAAMEAMITCDEDELTSRMQELEEISRRIDHVNMQVESLASGDPEHRHIIISAAYSRGNREDLPEELYSVFDSAQAGFASLNRADNSSLIVTERIKSRLQELDKQIRKLSVQPKIISYLNSGVSSDVSGGKIDSNI
ncbi:MAG: hypothetical protein ACOX1Q_09200 [Eubacteriales bacterium]|jgi:archaellum component FlaC